MTLQHSFRTLANPLYGFFFNPARDCGPVAKTHDGAKKLFQIPLHFFGSAQKISKLKSCFQSRPKAFKLSSRNFPLFPVSAFPFKRQRRGEENSTRAPAAGGRGTNAEESGAKGGTNPAQMRKGRAQRSKRAPRPFARSFPD
ncbi:MAG: hypothetical protein DBX55_03260 [Verrucomicrobia bacterium]|nr:MAG: hypothetical protein DBX55_03260 [Verrucomicrobiota bacterium]